MTTSLLGAITVIVITVIICITVNVCNKREHERYKYNEIKVIIDEIKDIYNTGIKEKERYTDILNKIVMKIKEIDKL